MAERDQNGKGRAIEQWRPGRRIPTLLPEERGSAAPARLEIDPALWREVRLVQDDAANGGVLTMALLRPLDWLEQQGVTVGAWVSMDLPEMGVQGEALVTAVHPCPEIEEGEGRLVTGTFRRSKALVLELKVSGEPEVLGVTGYHMVWSEDRLDWVAVKDLHIGERMRAWDGSTPEVESLTACSEPEPVYNIEVEGDHCYRVGEQGLLVHNTSAPSFRILRPNQSPGAANLTVGCVVRDQPTIVQVIGNTLTAQGSNTSPITGFYAFLRGGASRGGAGFQAVTKNPLTRLAVVIANIGQSQGTVGAAIDISALNQANVFDLEDANVWQQLVTRFPQNQAFFTQLRGEGLVGVMGSIPASAVRAIVLLPTNPTDRDAALNALLS